MAYDDLDRGSPEWYANQPGTGQGTPGTPSGGQAQAPAPQGPVGSGGYSAEESYKRWWINQLYQQYLGRDANDGELSGFSTYQPEQIQQIVSRSPEAAQYTTRQSQQSTGQGQSPAGGGSDRERIDAMLKAVNSTDDPNYWYGIAQQHGGLDNTGVDWMNDRIRRGDGSELVTSGQIEKFGGDASSTNFPEFNYKPWDQTFDGPDWEGGDFVAPTAATEENDPGYAFRLGEGEKALRRRAAASGTLYSGATDKALSKYGQDYASAEYEKVYGRALGEYTQKYSQFNDDYSKALKEYQTAYGEYNDEFGRNLEKYHADYGGATDQYNRGWNQYLNSQIQQQQGYQNMRGEQNDYWNRLNTLYGAGSDAAARANTASQNLSNWGTSSLEGQGNVNAAGQASSADAWARMLSNSANSAAGTYLSIYGNNQNQGAGAYPYYYGTQTGKNPWSNVTFGGGK